MNATKQEKKDIYQANYIYWKVSWGQGMMTRERIMQTKLEEPPKIEWKNTEIKVRSNKIWRSKEKRQGMEENWKRRKKEWIIIK